MTILVQWKWQERTKSFLVIFHFYKDYSKLKANNLRFKRGEYPDEQLRPVMTWAPSHIELGLLSELLGYANKINGLSENEKRELRNKLEIEFPFGWCEELPKDCMICFWTDPITKEESYCITICDEYINCLKRLLKPHLRTK